MTTEVTKIWHVDSINLFNELSYDEKEKMSKFITTKKYKKNEHVYLVDDVSSDLFFISTGRVKVGKNANNGKESIKFIVYEGEMFGELGMIEDEASRIRRDFSQVMEDDTVICSIAYTDMEFVNKQYPFIRENLIKQISKRLKRTENRLESIMFKDARTRLVDFIKELAQDLGKPVGHEVLVKHRLTHQEIANITAISRQKVTTLLNELKQENKIHLERKSMLIRNMEALK